MARTKVDLELAQTFATHLLKVLEQKKMSRYHLAKITGIHESTIHGYIAKTHLPSLAAFAKIIIALKVSPNKFIGI